MRVCKKCGTEKPLTAEHFYVHGKYARGPMKGQPRYRHQCIICFNEGKKPSTPAQLEIAREYNRKMRALYRSDPEKGERMRQYDREWQRQKRQDQSYLRRDLAARREQYALRERMRRDAQGAELEPAPPRMNVHRTRIDSESFPALPAGPMAEAITRLIRRSAVGEFDGFSWDFYDEKSGKALPVHEAGRGEGVPSVRDTVCDRLGVNARALYRWREGEAKDVRFDVADKILTLAGWCWWDVWQRCKTDCSTLKYGPVCPSCNGYETAERVFESTDISHVA